MTLLRAPGPDIRLLEGWAKYSPLSLGARLAKLQRELAAGIRRWRAREEKGQGTVPVPHWRQQPIWLVPPFVLLSSPLRTAVFWREGEGEIRNYDYFPDKTRPKFRRRRRGIGLFVVARRPPHARKSFLRIGTTPFFLSRQRALRCFVAVVAAAAEIFGQKHDAALILEGRFFSRKQLFPPLRRNLSLEHMFRRRPRKDEV